MLINETNWSLFNNSSPVDSINNNDLDFDVSDSITNTNSDKTSSSSSSSNSIFKLDSSELKAKNFLNSFLIENSNSNIDSNNSNDSEDEFKFGDTFDIDNNDHELFLLNKIKEANRSLKKSTSTSTKPNLTNKINFFYFNQSKTTTTHLKPIASTKSLLTGPLKLLPFSGFNLAYNSLDTFKTSTAKLIKSNPTSKYSNLIETVSISPTRLSSNNSIKYFIKNDAIMYLKDKLFPSFSSSSSLSTSTSTIFTTTIFTTMPITNTTLNTTLTSTTPVLSSITAATRIIQPQVCNCSLGNGYNSLTNSNNYKLNSLEEYTNIWKLAFFVLAFLMGFISLILILTFSIRILISKIQKKNKFEINNNHRVKNLKLPRKTGNKISSISLFEFDPDACSSSNCGLSISRPSRNHSLSTTSLVKYNNSHLNIPASDKLKSKSSINSRSTTITTTGCASSVSNFKNYPLLNQIQAIPIQQQLIQNIHQHLQSSSSNLSHHHFVNPSLEESLRFLNSTNNNNSNNGNNNFTNLITEAVPNQNTQCFIYGIANKAFVDDFQANLYNTDSRHMQHPFENSYLCSFNNNNNNINSNSKLNIPSSFRPNPNNAVSNAKQNACDNKQSETKVYESKEADGNEKRLKKAEIKDEILNKKEELATYNAPWKLCNDYEALEANTVTGSMGNLSSVTTYSEVYDESKMLDCLDSKSFGGSSYYVSKSAAKDLNLISTNNNELISRSSKITQELEMKLKERRLMMESKSDKFQPKIIHQNEISPNTTTNKNSTPTEIEAKQQVEWQTQSELVVGESHSCSKKNVFVSSSQITSAINQNCICPCHAHGHPNKPHHHHHHHNHHHNHNHDKKHVSVKDLSSSSSTSTSSSSSDKSDSSAGSPSNPHVFVNKCHHHTGLNSIQTKNKQISSSSSTNKSESSISASSRTDLTQKYKKPKIIIDGSSTLPTKRESIRMLIENKAVSENKQKDRLEMHLNTLIGSRASTLNLNNIID